MKKVLLHSLLAVLVFIGLFAGTGKVSAVPGTAWATGIKLQNLDSATTAILSIEILSSAGASITTIDTTASGAPLEAEANKSVEVFLPSYNFGSGNYAAVVSSNVEIGVVVTNTNYLYGLADSYNAMTPATSISVPNVYHSHNSWSTEIFIQNTSVDTDANVSVVLKEPATSGSASDGAVTRTVPLVIPKNGSASIDTTKSEYGTGGLYDLGWFIGAATITSDIPVAVAVNQIRLVAASDAKGNVMISGRGMTSADSGAKIVLPSLYKEFTGVSGTWRSGIKLQNLHASESAHVVVTFLSDPNSPVFNTNNVRTLDIAGGDNAELYLGNVLMDDGTTSIPNTWRGSASVVVTGGTVVANVQHTNYNASVGYGVAIGYAGFSSGATNISLPTIYNWPSGAGVWVSGIKIQNLGGGQVTLHVEFTPDPDSINKTAGITPDIILNNDEAQEVYITNPLLTGGGKIPAGWKGSALVKVTSGTGTVVATAINTNYGRHVATMYTGVPVP